MKSIHLSSTKLTEMPWSEYVHEPWGDTCAYGTGLNAGWIWDNTCLGSRPFAAETE